MLASRAEDTLRAAGGHTFYRLNHNFRYLSRTSSHLLNCHRWLAKYKDSDSTRLSRPDRALASIKGVLFHKKWTFKDVSFIPDEFPGSATSRTYHMINHKSLLVLRSGLILPYSVV